MAVMLGGMRKSVHTKLDEFFGHLIQQAQLVQYVCERAYLPGRAKLAGTAIAALNDRFVARPDDASFVPRWHGLHLVAADASTSRSWPVPYRIRPVPTKSPSTGSCPAPNDARRVVAQHPRK